MTVMEVGKQGAITHLSGISEETIRTYVTKLIPNLTRPLSIQFEGALQTSDKEENHTESLPQIWAPRPQHSQH